MKKIYYLFFGGLVLVSSCDNKDDKPNPTTTEPEKTNFSINHITDVTMAENGMAYLSILVELKNSIQEPVQIAVKDLPANVTCTISPEKGTSTFITTLTLKANMAAIGEYLPKITLTSTSGATKAYDFKIKITQPADAMNRIVGNYLIGANSCDTVTRVLVVRPFQGTIVRFFQLMKDSNFDAVVDTVAKTITIPSQTFFGIQGTYEATGNYTNKAINLNGTIHYPGGGNGTPCNLVLTKY